MRAPDSNHTIYIMHFSVECKWTRSYEERKGCTYNSKYHPCDGVHGVFPGQLLSEGGGLWKGGVQSVQRISAAQEESLANHSQSPSCPRRSGPVVCSAASYWRTSLICCWERWFSLPSSGPSKRLWSQTWAPWKPSSSTGAASTPRLLKCSWKRF